MGGRQLCEELSVLSVGGGWQTASCVMRYLCCRWVMGGRQIAV